MANLSVSTRPDVIRKSAPAWRRRTAGLCAAGAGAAFVGLLMAPLADADADPAYGDLSMIYDAVTTFENSYGSYEDALFDSDLTNLGNIISATGFDVGDPFSSGATVSNDLSSIAAEDNTVTAQLTNLEQTIAGESGPAATYTDKELPVIEETLAFQQQINSAISDLPSITAQEETNPALISDLSALDINETKLDGNLINLGYELLSPAGTTGDNAAILSDGLGIAIDTQSTAETLTLLADLSSIGL
jgi:hypothetical protein